MSVISDGYRYVRDAYKVWRSLTDTSRRELRSLPILHRLYVLSLMAWKPVVLLRVSDTCIFLKQGDSCVEIPISKVNRVEEDVDPLLGNIHKIYISENNYHMVKEIADTESLDRLKLLFGDKYIERKNRE